MTGGQTGVAEMGAGGGGAGVRVYETRQHVGLQASLCIAGGVAFLLVLVAMFVLLLAAKDSGANHTMPGVIGGMSVIGIGLIARGVFLLKAVVRVTLDANAVHLDGFIGRRSVPYQQIERVARDKQNLLLGGKTIEVLALHAAGQKQPVAIIPETIDRFEQLAAELAARTAAAQGGRVTYDPVADQQQRDAREVRRLKWTSIAFVVFTLLFVAIFIGGVHEELGDRALTRDGRPVDARISRHFTIRVTPYIAYTFTDDRGGRHSREVMVTQELFDSTEGQATVPVVYLPADPEQNRLVGGSAETSFGGKFLLLSGGGSLVLGALAVMTLFGFDMKTENGHTRLTRYGKTVREWGVQAGSSTPPALPPMPAFDRSAAPVEGPCDDDVDDSRRPPPLSETENARIGQVVAAYNAQQPVYPPEPPPPPRRPSGLVALALFCVVFGVLGLAAAAVRVYLTAGPRTVTLSDRVMTIDPSPAWLRVWSAADGVLALLLITTGVGLFALKGWSRRLGIGVAALQIVSTIGAIVTLMARTEVGDDPGSMNVIAAATGAVIFHIVTMVFPGVLMFVLAKRSTAQALV